MHTIQHPRMERDKTAIMDNEESNLIIQWIFVLKTVRKLYKKITCKVGI